MITFNNTLQSVGCDPRVATISDKIQGGNVRLLRTKFEIFIGEEVKYAVWRRADSAGRAELWGSNLRAEGVLRSFCRFMPPVKTAVYTPIPFTLLTGWSIHSGSFSVFNTTGTRITEATSTIADSWIRTNDFWFTKGATLSFIIQNAHIPPGVIARLYRGDTLIGSTSDDLPLKSENAHLFVTDVAATYHIRVGRPDGVFSLSWNKSQIAAIFKGNYPVVYFKVRATEYWEDQHNIVVKGNTIETSYSLFFPTDSDLNIFESEIVRSFPAKSIGLHYQGGNGHVWPLMFASRTYDIFIWARYPNVAEHIIAQVYNMGWGIINISDSTFPLLAQRGSMDIKISDNVDDLCSWITIKHESRCSVYSLIFLGRRGLEYLPFRNLDTLKIRNRRENWRNEKGVELPISNEVTRMHTLRTIYESEQTLELIGELLETTHEVYINGEGVDNVECGVVESDVTIRDQDEMTINTVAVQYYL